MDFFIECKFVSPPVSFQEVLRISFHYNLPLLLPLPIYAEQDAMPDDGWHQFQGHNDKGYSLYSDVCEVGGLKLGY